MAAERIEHIVNYLRVLKTRAISGTPREIRCTYPSPVTRGGLSLTGEQPALPPPVHRMGRPAAITRQVQAEHSIIIMADVPAVTILIRFATECA